MSSSDASRPSAPTPEELKGAIKAFKKKLKLTRLDDQSRIGVGPMSSGRESGIVGIAPPDKYPQSVWDELERQGRLKKIESGLYEMVQPPQNRGR
ncbi:MAG: hypothetical protein ACYC6Y_23290 [Thermoguttaceae bacterium]